MFIPKLLIISALFLFTSCKADDAKSTSKNPNVWNFQIARKVIAAFEYDGMGMSIWEDQGVENTTVTSNRQFYVTPITKFLSNDTKCDYNELTNTNFVSYNIEMWDDRLQSASIDRLKLMQIIVTPEQVQPLPFYQVRVIWNNAQEKLNKATLQTMWNNNLQQQSVQRFKIIADDQATCQKLAEILKNKPQFFTDSIALEYSLSAATTATRILSVKGEHFLNSQLMATLKTMDVSTPERYLTANDANKLSSEIMDNIIATQIVDGEYVPDADQLTLKDLITSTLQVQNMDVGNISQRVWESTFWDPSYARPDRISSYLNKVLTIDNGQHQVRKSSSFDNKDEYGAKLGIVKWFNAEGSVKTEKHDTKTFDELKEWLRQNQYDVEIQGDIFVPKSLNLQRINLGVLNRQETIFTKSVQMHHIDAPGLLRVTVGNEKRDDTGDEDIKSLRDRIGQLEKWQASESAVDNRLGSVETRVNGQETRTGALEARMNSVEGNLRDGWRSRVENFVSCVSNKHVSHCVY